MCCVRFSLASLSALHVAQVTHVQAFGSCEIIPWQGSGNEPWRKRMRSIPFSPALLHPNVVKGGHLYIFAPLKVTPFFLIRHSPSPPVSLSLSRRIPRGVGWGGQGIHESSLCTACQRFLPDPPPTCAFLADPCFNCLLHDKRVASHEGQIFHPGKFSLFPLR